MNLDLKTAIAVRERDDGLLEKDSFDLSTARPVAEIRAALPGEIPYRPPAIKERANVELAYKEAGLPVPAGLRFEWELTSPQKQAATGLVATTALTEGLNLVVQGVRGIADKDSKGNLFDKAFKGIVYPEATARVSNKLPGTEDLPSWAKLTVNIVDDIISYGVVAVAKGAIKETLLAKDIYRKLDVPATAYAKDKMTGYLPSGNKTETAVFEGYKQEYREIALKKFTSLEAELVASEEAIGSGQGGGSSQLQEYARKRSLLGLIIDDLKHTNNKGQLRLPTAGQSIGFKGPDGTMSEGIIRKVTGKLAEIELSNQPGRIIVATLSQLSLPEVPKEPVLPTKEAQGGTIIPEKTVTQPTGEGQKPPVEPPKTAVSGGPAPEEPPKPIIKNLNISEEAKATIEEASAQIKPELEKIKGKPLTHDEVVEAAQQSDILSKVISREESKVFEARILRTRQNLAAMAEDKGVTQEFIDTLKTVKSFGTDAARKLGSLRIGAESSEFNVKTKLVNKLLENNVEIDDIIKASEGVDFNNQEHRTKLYRQFIKPKVWDLLNEYRYINLLSSPKTHIVNTFSNLIQVSGLAPGTKLFAGDVKGSTAFYRGAWNAIGEAKVKALDALKGKSLMERPDVEHIPSDSKLLKWGRWIPQALEASDVFFRTIAYEGELAAQLAKGIEPGEAAKIAKDTASYYVFRKALDPSNKTGQGKLLSAIDNLTTLAYKARTVPGFGRLISWYIPFVQTLMNISKQMIEYSPVGFSTMPGVKDKKGQLAKALLGSFIFGAAAYLVSKNETTWDVPTGKKERDLFFAAGRQPFSIKIGNTWIGYSRLGTLAFPIAIPAAIKNYTQQNPSSATDNNLQKTAKVIGGLGEFFASMSYVEGIGQLVGLIKNAPGAASKLLMEGPSQLIPVSSLQRWVNNFIIDPIYRKTEKDMSADSIIDEARKSIIFGTKGLPAYENPEGEESRRSYPGLNAFSPIPITKSNYEYEEEYKQYIEERKEDLIEKKESGDEPKTRSRRRR